MIYLILTGIAVCIFVGGPLAVLAVLVARMQDPGRHCAAARVPAPRRPVNGRYLGTMPRRTPHPTAADPVTPAQTDDAPPWDVTTTSLPALDDERRYPCCAHCEGFVCDRPYHPAPCDEDGCQLDAADPDAPEYGQACQLVVAAAQNPALRDQPVVPAYMSAPAGGAE